MLLTGIVRASFETAGLCPVLPAPSSFISLQSFLTEVMRWISLRSEWHLFGRKGKGQRELSLVAVQMTGSLCSSMSSLFYQRTVLVALQTVPQQMWDW